MDFLVVDTNCFLHNLSKLKGFINEKQIITTYSVMEEIRKPEQIQNIQLMIPNLKKIDPSKDSIKYVKSFAKKTGDLVSLSQQDIDIIALAVDKVKANEKFDKLAKKPKKLKNQVGQNKKDKNGNQEMLGWGGNWGDNDDGWVGPQNFDKLKQENKDQDNQQNLGVFVITTDYAMQNVLLQIKIPLLNLDGKVITKLKSFVLECFTCKSISKNNNDIFCKSCGKNTLLKVTCEYDQDGQLILYRKKNHQVKVRGSKYPIPLPKGGRKINDLILTEDGLNQPKVQSYVRKMNIQERKQRKVGNDLFDNGLGIEDYTKQNKNFKGVKVGYGKKNPNVNAFWKASRNTNVIRLVEDLQLTEFYDNGGNLVFLSDTFTLQTWRISLNLFGFDQYTPSELDFSYDVNTQQYNEYKDIFIPKEDIQFQEFSRDIKKGIYYTGGMISLTPYENQDQWSFLSPSFDTVLKNNRKQIYQNKELIHNNLIVGAQNKQSLSRVLVVGSFKIFSNDYFNKSEGDNFFLARNLMNWVDYKNHVLDLEYYSICSNNEIDCKQQTIFKPYDKIYIKLRVLDDNGEFYQDSNDKIYLRMKMMDIYLQQPMEITTIDDKKYYIYSFEAFDKIGIYKISLIYHKPGFYLDQKQFEQEIIIKYQKPQISSLKNIPSLLYLLSVFVVCVSALNISYVVISKTKFKQF